MKRQIIEFVNKKNGSRARGTVLRDNRRLRESVEEQIPGVCQSSWGQ